MEKMTMAEYKEELTGMVLSEINGLAGKAISFPENYAPQNALLAAWLTIEQTADKNSKPVLEVCTSTSVKLALLEMLTKGLNPAKAQCYFVVYGNKLVCMTSYFGLQVMARRADPSITKIYAEVVRDGDEFIFDVCQGRKIVRTHVQSLSSLDKPIVAAYATIIRDDGSETTEVMSIAQINKAWSFGQAKGQSPAHTKTPEEMAKKSVLHRLVKNVVNISDDSCLSTIFDDVQAEVSANQALEEMEIKDITPCDEAETQETAAESPEVLDFIEENEMPF